MSAAAYHGRDRAGNARIPAHLVDMSGVEQIPATASSKRLLFCWCPATRQQMAFVPHLTLGEEA